MNAFLAVISNHLAEAGYRVVDGPMDDGVQVYVPIKRTFLQWLGRCRPYCRYDVFVADAEIIAVNKSTIVSVPLCDPTALDQFKTGLVNHATLRETSFSYILVASYTYTVGFERHQMSCSCSRCEINRVQSKFWSFRLVNSRVFHGQFMISWWLGSYHYFYYTRLTE